MDAGRKSIRPAVMRTFHHNRREGAGASDDAAFLEDAVADRPVNRRREFAPPNAVRGDQDARHRQTLKPAVFDQELARLKQKAASLAVLDLAPGDVYPPPPLTGVEKPDSCVR